MPWYRNTSVWSVFIALTALLLSQLPPIQTWFSKPKLEITHSDRVGINNAIGIIGLNLPVELDNKGNVPIDISSLEIILKTPSGKTKTLKAESYMKPSSDGGPSISIPITTINIPVGNVWGEFVFFNREVSPTEEEKYNELRLNISQNVFDKQQNAPLETYNPHIVTSADEDIVDRAKAFFDSNFDLEKGEYKVQIVAKSKQRSEPFILNSHFTIYEYHIKTIESQVEDYKYGAGIYFPINNSKQAWVRIRPDK